MGISFQVNKKEEALLCIPPRGRLAEGEHDLLVAWVCVCVYIHTYIYKASTRRQPPAYRYSPLNLACKAANEYRTTQEQNESFFRSVNRCQEDIIIRKRKHAA